MRPGSARAKSRKRGSPPGAPLWLASSSPRRRSLLREHGYRFRWVRPGVDETVPGHLAADRAALAIARRKAEHVARSLGSRAPGVVLAADTIVAAGKQLLGKANNPDEARRSLALLSGTTHRVVTGVCLIEIPTMRRALFRVVTRVTMRRWTGREIANYVRSGEWKGKAGAYAIQESADRFVTRIAGSFTNVVGLPMERVARELRKLGISAEPRRARGRAIDRNSKSRSVSTRARRRR